MVQVAYSFLFVALSIHASIAASTPAGNNMEQIVPVIDKEQPALHMSNASDGPEVSIMSFNIRYGTAKDGPNAWPHRHTIVQNMLLKYMPDIVATQECLDFQADYLTDQIEGYRWFGPGRESDGTGERMAVLYREDVLLPLQTGSFWLSEQPDTPGSRSWDTACTRMVTWARFHHYASGQVFTVFNTHFDHRSEQARVESARMLSRIAHEALASSPVIITGDFNAVATESEPWHIFIDAGFQDSWLIAEERRGPAQTFFGFQAPDPDADQRIDWILTGPGIKVDLCETIDYNEDHRYPSDHLPVYAVLRFQPVAHD